MFSAFTVGQFVKGIYDANIGLLKLQKAMLFQTGTMEDAHKATDEFIHITDSLGLSLSESMESYGRFAISAKASGLDLKQTNDVYKSIGTALQVVGADSHQTTLSFFALTEMLQKGTVHSKEFNRQLGQQIPGNAVIGAQALSHLMGRFVSVAEFFQLMQKNQIDSAQFVPEYAKAVSAMYTPLLGLVKMRPDAALNSLKSAFMLFAQGVGNGGFMGSLSKGLTDLHDKIIITKDGVESLTPAAQHLAETMGKNLANLIHGLTEGIGFMASHIDELVMGLKGMLGLKVASTFLEWNAKADAMAASTAKQAQATMALAQAKKAEAVAAREAAAAEAMSAAAATAGNAGFNLSAASKTGFFSRFARATPAATTLIASEAAAGEAATYFGGSALGKGGAAAAMEAEMARRAALQPRGMFGSLSGAAGMTSGNLTGPMMGIAGSRAAFGAASGADIIKVEQAVAKSAFSFKAVGEAAVGMGSALGGFARGGLKLAADGIMGFGKMLPGIGTIAIAAAVGLAVFSDTITEFKTKAGNAVKVGDIVSGFFDSIGKSVGKWFSTMTGGLVGFDGQTVEWGKLVAIFLASVETVAGTLFGAASALGQVLGTLIANILTMVIDVGKAGSRLMHGDLKGAAGALGSAPGQIADQWKGVGKLLADDFRLSNPFQNMQDILAGAANAADKRGNATAADIGQTKVYQDAEEKLAISQKQMADEQTRGEIEQINRRIAMSDTGIPKIEDLLAKIDESAKNQTSAVTSTAQAASATATAAQAAAASAKGTGGNIPAATGPLANAIYKAAADKGVDPGLLMRIAYKESGYRMDAAPRDANGKLASSAVGPFQITEGTAKLLGMDASLRTDAMASAQAAAQLLKINGSFLQAKLGREATGGELYGAHVLGAGGGVKLAKMAEDKPQAIAADAFKVEANNNPGLFYADSKHKTGALTAAQVMGRMNAVGGSSTGLTGKMLTPATETDAESLISKFDTATSQYQKLIGQHNPAQEALSQYNEFVLSIQKLTETQAAMRAKNPDLKAFIKTDEVKAEADRLKKLAEDASNPFAKTARQDANDAQVMEMRAKGLSDEADFQAKLNGLVEQGYKATILDTAANRDSMKAAKDRRDLLQSQLDVTTALNEATIAKIGRTGNAFDAGLASRIKIDPGKTYAQAVQDAKDNGSYANLVKAEQAREGERRAGVVAAKGSEISEATATARLDPSTKAYRENFKAYLKDITGVQSDSLDIIAAHASAADVALAKSYADMKQKLENPPGFQKWADSLEPLSKRMEDIKANFAEGLSGAITDALSGDKVDWQGLMKSTMKQVLKAQVDTAMGGVIGFLTGKKPQKPEDIATAAANVQATASDSFSTGVQSFSGAVDAFSQAVDAAATAAAAPAGGSGFGAGAANDNGFGFGSPGAFAANDNGGDFLNGSAGFDPSTLASLGFGGGDAGGYSPMDVMSNDLGIVDQSAMLNPDLISTGVPDFTGASGGGAGGLGGLLSSLGGGGKGGGLMSGLMGAAGIGSVLYNLFHKKKEAYATPPPINGVIGESRPVNVTGREIAAHGNPIGMLLSTAVSMAGGAGFGAPGGNLTSFLGSGGGMGSGGGIGSWLGRMFGGGAGGGMGGGGGLSSLFSMIGGMFSEGGYSNKPVGTRVMSMHAWRDAPHYSEGTSNTSGGMPAILHPNEAVIPLSRGRSIPVDLGDHAMGGNHTSMNTNITVIAPNPDAFRQSRGSIQRQTNRDMKRAAARNLTA
jgi:hypothetical protein